MEFSSTYNFSRFFTKKNLSKGITALWWLMIPFVSVFLPVFVLLNWFVSKPPGWSVILITLLIIWLIMQLINLERQKSRTQYTFEIIALYGGIVLLAINVFAAVSFILSINGKADYHSDKYPITLLNMFSFYCWQFIDMLPLLDFQKDSNFAVSFTAKNRCAEAPVVLFRLFILWQVIKSFAEWYKRENKFMSVLSFSNNKRIKFENTADLKDMGDMVRMVMSSGKNKTNINSALLLKNLALFKGKSINQKHLFVALLGKNLNREVYRIDLSRVVSEYIGTTVKNIKSIFDTAEYGNPILFFDEADSLFEKRSNVNDSHDHYANQEVSYLMQRTESYNGTVIISLENESLLSKEIEGKFSKIVCFPLEKK